MIKQKIESIHEAFSMQPAGFRIGSKVDTDVVLTEMKQEQKVVDGNPVTYIVGYDQNGNKIFQYLKISINIHYKN